MHFVCDDAVADADGVRHGHCMRRVEFVSLSHSARIDNICFQCNDSTCKWKCSFRSYTHFVIIKWHTDFLCLHPFSPAASFVENSQAQKRILNHLGQQIKRAFSRWMCHPRTNGSVGILCARVKVYPFALALRKWVQVHSVIAGPATTVVRRTKWHWVRARVASFAGQFRHFARNKHATIRRRRCGWGVSAWHIFVFETSLPRHCGKIHNFGLVKRQNAIHSHICCVCECCMWTCAYALCSVCILCCAPTTQRYAITYTLTCFCSWDRCAWHHVSKFVDSKLFESNCIRVFSAACRSATDFRRSVQTSFKFIYAACIVPHTAVPLHFCISLEQVTTCSASIKLHSLQ